MERWIERESFGFDDQDQGMCFVVWIDWRSCLGQHGKGMRHHRREIKDKVEGCCDAKASVNVVSCLVVFDVERRRDREGERLN